MAVPCLQSRFVIFMLVMLLSMPALASLRFRVAADMAPALHDTSTEYPDLPVATAADTQLESRYMRFRRGLERFFRQDYSGAINILRPLARGGYVSAQYYMGIIRDRGVGVKKDAGRAMHWYLQAARQGHLGAQYNVGVAYANGDGVVPDMARAVAWWRKAARRGNLDAQYNLGMIYMSGRGVKRDILEAVKWWRMAAMHGDVVAQYNLGVIFANGDGVKRDVCRASRYWQTSAAQGFARAREALKTISGMVSPARCMKLTAAR